MLFRSEYHRLFPGHDVRFIAIGNTAFSKPIERVAPMPMHELMDFYRQEVDIMVSIDTAKAFNGWPLGVEAALNGAVLITTDIANANQHYGFPNESLFIFDLNQRSAVVEFIHEMNVDRRQLMARSQFCQRAFLTFYAYEAQQGRIFKYLDALFNATL